MNLIFSMKIPELLFYRAKAQDDVTKISGVQVKTNRESIDHIY